MSIDLHNSSPSSNTTINLNKQFVKNVKQITQSYCQRDKISDDCKDRLMKAYQNGGDYLGLAKQLGIKKSTAYTIIRRRQEPKKSNGWGGVRKRKPNQKMYQKTSAIHKASEPENFSPVKLSILEVEAKNSQSMSQNNLDNEMLTTTNPTILHSLLVEQQAGFPSCSLSAFKRYSNYDDYDDQNDLRRRANSLSLPHNKSSAFRPRSATNSLTKNRYNPYPVVISVSDSSTGSSYANSISSDMSTTTTATYKKSCPMKQPLNYSESLLKDALTGRSLQPDVSRFYQNLSPQNSCLFASPSEPPVSSRAYSVATHSKPPAFNTIATTLSTSSIVESILAQDLSSDCAGRQDTASSSRYDSALTSSNTVVQLAKKNLFPVQSRISELLKLNAAYISEKIIDFKELSESSKLLILRKVWHRLLILSMIQHNFSFTVTEHCKSTGKTANNLNEQSSISDDRSTRSPDSDSTSQINEENTEPTMLFTNELKEIISEGYSLKLSQQTFDLLRLSVISQFCYPHYFKSSYNDVMKSISLQLTLKDFSLVLLLMTKLHHFDSEIIRKLFCTHLPIQLTVEAAILSAIES